MDERIRFLRFGLEFNSSQQTKPKA